MAGIGGDSAQGGLKLCAPQQWEQEVDRRGKNPVEKIKLARGV